jgi:hypothetical protein
MNPTEGLPYGLAERINAARYIPFEVQAISLLPPGMTLKSGEGVVFYAVRQWLRAIEQGGVPPEVGWVETGEQGEVWVRLTLSQLVEVIWVGMYVEFTEKVGQRHLDGLVKKGVLQRARLGQHRDDSTYFYRLAITATVP